MKMVTGATIVQLVGLLAMPIVTRLFPPQAFGLSGLFLSMASVTGVVACLKYEMAVVLPDRDEEARSLLLACLLFSIGTALLVAVGVVLCGSMFETIFNNENLGEVLYLLPLMTLSLGVTQGLDAWYTRVEKFGRLSSSRVLQALGLAGLRLGFGGSGWQSGGGLITAQIVARFAAVAFLLQTILRGGGKAFFQCRLVTLRQVLVSYSNFPKYNLWSGFLVGTSVEMPVLIFSMYYAPEVIGLLVLTRTIFSIPLRVLGSSVAQTFYRKASDLKYEERKLRDFAAGIHLWLVIISVVPILCMAVVGEDLFRIFFGEEWLLSGVLARVLCVAVYFEFVTFPLGGLFNVLGEQRMALQLNLVMFLTRFLSIVAGCLVGDIVQAIGLYVLGDVLGRFIKFSWLFKRLGLSRIKLVYAGHQMLFLLLTFMPLFYMVNHYVSKDLLYVCLVMILMALYGLVLLLWCKHFSTIEV